MTQSTTGAAPSGAASGRSATRARAARSETNGKGKTAEFRGLTLMLPKECPGEVLFAVEGDNISDVLRTLVGEDQYLAIREKVAGDKLTLNQTRDQLVELVRFILEDTYKITAGE